MEPWLDPLLDADAMRAVDSWAIDERGVPSLELMEAAGAAVAAAVEELRPEGPVRVVCGKGNNGGDGLVAARLLAATGFDAEVLLLWPADELSDDAKPPTSSGSRGPSASSAPGETSAALDGSGAIVDAIFGTGFSGAPREPAAAAIEAINAAAAPVVAADIASGVDAATGEVEGAATEATVTVTFHAAKIGHQVAPGKRHAGRPRGCADRDSRRRAGISARWTGAHRGARGASRARGRLDEVQLRPGAGRRRLARADGRRMHVGGRCGARRSGLRDGRRSG